MTVQELFEQVNLVTPTSQRNFFRCLNSSLSELAATYDQVECWPVSALTDEVPVDQRYHDGILNNILFLLGGEEANKTEFVRKSRNAYLAIWREKAKGKRMKRGEW